MSLVQTFESTLELAQAGEDGAYEIWRDVSLGRAKLQLVENVSRLIALAGKSISSVPRFRPRVPIRRGFSMSPG